jgi:hypothetical protein
MGRTGFAGLRLNIRQLAENNFSIRYSVLKLLQWGMNKTDFLSSRGNTDYFTKPLHQGAFYLPRNK